MRAIPSIDDTHLEAICSVLGDTSAGLSGTQIGRYLKDCGISDPSPSFAKRQRLYDALRNRQIEDKCANNVFAFIKKVMSPALYHAAPEAYEAFRSRLNTPLAFTGYKVDERGEIVVVAAARTLSEAENRAAKLQTELRKRRVHADVLAYCKSELLEENYFHAVLEATKSVAEKIRQRSGLSTDGGELANAAFALGKVGMPFLAFNSLTSDTEKSEQSGLMNLFIGMFGTFRNVTAHGPKIHWKIDEQDALDLLTLVSMLHRRLDAAHRTPRV